MKVEKIIDHLCNHEISKTEAIGLIRETIDSLRSKAAVKFLVEEVAFSVESNDAVLKLRAPYNYKAIEGKVEYGDAVDVIILP